MSLHYDVHLINPVEFGDGSPDYVDGFNDDHQAIKLHFEVGDTGKGLWVFEPGSAGNAFVQGDRCVTIPISNTALIEIWED